MDDHEVFGLLVKAFEIGYAQCRVDLGNLKPYISRGKRR